MVRLTKPFLLGNIWRRQIPRLLLNDYWRDEISMARHIKASPSFTVSYWIYIQGKINYFKAMHKRAENFTFLSDQLIIGHFYEPVSKTYSISVCRTQSFA